MSGHPGNILYEIKNLMECRAQFNQEDYAENCLAIAGDLAFRCAESNPCGRTPQADAMVVFDEIGPEKVEMVKVGLSLCRCCVRHKEDHCGEFMLSAAQIAYMVPVDDPACSCMCSVYLKWLSSLENHLLRLELPEPPSDWFQVEEDPMTHSLYMDN
jgi:hypothetical protein